MPLDVCVIGAGVVGLSSTLHIQRLIHNVKVTVIADSYGTETNTPLTENLFIPAPFTIEKDIGITAAKEWFLDGWKHHFELATQMKETEEKRMEEKRERERKRGAEKRRKEEERIRKKDEKMRKKGRKREEEEEGRGEEQGKMEKEKEKEGGLVEKEQGGKRENEKEVKSGDNLMEIENKEKEDVEDGELKNEEDSDGEEEKELQKEERQQEESEQLREEREEELHKYEGNGHTFKTGICLWYHTGPHIMKDAVMDYRELSREEMDNRDFRYAYGCEFTTVHIDQKWYLRWLLKEIRANGGIIRYDTVCSFQELYGQFDVIVNCVGKRGRELSADPHLLSFRGTMVQTTPIDSEDFLMTQDHVFVCPNPHTGYCDVGFLYDWSKRNTELDDDTIWLVKYKGCQLVPQLQKTEIVHSWAELRVEREPIRLEIEMLDCGGPILPIVHNVGHGENAVSLAWGRGYQVAHLVQEVKRLSKPFAWKWYPFGKL